MRWAFDALEEVLELGAAFVDQVCDGAAHQLLAGFGRDDLFVHNVALAIEAISQECGLTIEDSNIGPSSIVFLLGRESSTTQADHLIGAAVEELELDVTSALLVLLAHACCSCVIWW